MAPNWPLSKKTNKSTNRNQFLEDHVPLKDLCGGFECWVFHRLSRTRSESFRGRRHPVLQPEASGIHRPAPPNGFFPCPWHPLGTATKQQLGAGGGWEICLYRFNYPSFDWGSPLNNLQVWLAFVAAIRSEHQGRRNPKKTKGKERTPKGTEGNPSRTPRFRWLAKQVNTNGHN